MRELKLFLVAVLTVLMFSQDSKAQVSEIMLTKSNGTLISVQCQRQSTRFAMSLNRKILLDVEVRDFEIIFRSQGLCFRVVNSDEGSILDKIILSDSAILEISTPEKDQFYYINLTFRQDFWVIEDTATDQVRLEK